MEKSDIQIKNAIIHILATGSGAAVYSEAEADGGSDFSDFLKEHIYRIYQSDDIKSCHFSDEESKVLSLIREMLEDKRDFVSMSRELCGLLYGIMEENIDIPSADVAVVYFEVNTLASLAILKMNYKESYTHATQTGKNGNINRIIKYHSILPSG